MKKHFSKIVGLSLGIALAIGVSVGVSSQRKITRLYADAGDTYERVSSANDISDGDYIIFVNQAETYASSQTQNNNNRGMVAIQNVSNHTLSIPNDSTIQEYLVVEGETDGQFGFYTGTGFLTANGGTSSNYLTSPACTNEASNVTGTKAWTFASVSNSVFSVENVGKVYQETTHYYLAFNGTTIFSAYRANQTKPYIYKKTAGGSGSTTYSVTYDANGGTGTMTDSNSYEANDDVTVLDNEFTRVGYTFDHWNTRADNNGTSYDEGDTFKITASTILYAQWEEIEIPSYTKDLAFHFVGADIHGSQTSYNARSAEVDSGTESNYSTATWQITVGNNTAQLGTNANASNLSKATLGNGEFGAASGLATALGITTTTQKYSAAICTTAMKDVHEVDLIYTGTNGGNITTAWILSSTNGTTWEIEAMKTTSIPTGSTFRFIKNTDSRQYAFVAYWDLTNSGGLKGFELKLFGEYPQAQKYTVTYNAGTNGSGSFEHTNNYAGSYELLAFNELSGVSPNSGYRFVDYTVNDEQKNPGETITLSATITITVNFEALPPMDVLNVGTTGAENTTYIDWSDKAGSTTNAIYSGNSSKSSHGAIQMRTTNNNSGIVSTVSPGKIKCVVVTWNTTDCGSSAKTLDVYAKNTPYYAATDLYSADASVKGTKIGSISYTSTTNHETELVVSGDYTYIGIRSNNGALYLDDVSFEWQITVKGTVESTLESISALKFNYVEEVGDTYSYDETAIRFGGLISQNMWAQLNGESTIQGYGVLVAANSDLDGKTIRQRYYEAKTDLNTVEDAIDSIHDDFDVGKKIVTSKPNPAVATSEQKEFLGVSGDYYIWTVQKPFGSNFTTSFNAVAFILIDGDIVFLEEVSLSAKDIATRDVPVDDQDTYYEPIHYMANMA